MDNTNNGSKLRLELHIDAPDLGEVHIERLIDVDRLIADRVVWELGSLAAMFLGEGRKPSVREVPRPAISAAPAVKRSASSRPIAPALPQPKRKTKAPKITAEGKKLFGRLLQAWRLERDWSVAELSARIGFHGSTINTWELGKFAPAVRPWKSSPS